MVTVYRSDDASAPVLDDNQGSLINLLDKVLVDGYGDKTSLGWTKSFSGLNKAAYRLPEGSRSYLRVQDGSVSAQVRGYKEMINVDGTDLALYVSNPFPDLGTNVYLWKTDGPGIKSWLIIGCEIGFYMYTGVTNTNLDSETFDPEFANLFYFGDQVTRNPIDNVYCGVVIGSELETPTSNEIRFGLVSDFGYSGFSGHYVSRNYETSIIPGYTGTSGIGVSFSKGRNYRLINNLGNTMGVSIPDAFPNPITGRADICEIVITESNTIFRGKLPGLYEIISGRNVGDLFTTVIGTNSVKDQEFMILPSCNEDKYGRIMIQTQPNWIEL